MENVFGSILKDLRASERLSQEELSKIIGVSQKSISCWENGLHEPKLMDLIALAKYFDVSLDYLAGLE